MLGKKMILIRCVQIQCHVNPQVILAGISGGMVASVCASTPKKHEFLLYCSISVLVVNTINLIFLEFGQIKDLFTDSDQMHMGKEYEVLESANGRLITTVTAITSVLISFVESQISFCLLNRMQLSYNKAKFTKGKSRYVDTDQSADLEYVIPKVSATRQMCAARHSL